MVVASARACIDSQDWLQSGMQTETGFKSPNEQTSVLCCSRTLMDRRLKPSGEVPLKCPRCDSTNTKFCYYNNYSLTQPRYFCKTCRRYWTKGGSLRNVPVGGGCRKNKRNSKRSSADQNPVIPGLRVNAPSANSANSPSNNPGNDEGTDGSPNNLDRQDGILPGLPSPVYFGVGLNGGDGPGVAYAAIQHQHQRKPMRVTGQSGLARNNNCSDSSAGMLGDGSYNQQEPAGPALQSSRPPFVDLNGFQSLKSTCSLIAGLESSHRTCSRAAADQGAALMNISGDLSSIFELTLQNQQQITTSSARPISQVRVGNSFNDAFNLVAVHDNGLNDVQWQQQRQKQPVAPLEDDNGQVNDLLPFDHRRHHHHNPENAVEEFRIPADHQSTLRQFVVKTTTIQQPLPPNEIYEENRSAPYNWQAPNLSESLILNETSGGLNTGYWNLGTSWPDLSCLDLINTEFSS